MELLRAEGISKHFGGVYALRNASFSMRAGEVHALVGENGAGKSTFGKILAGVVKPDEGNLFLNDMAFRPGNPREAQQHGIAMIFQELDLFPNLSVAENIAATNLAIREGTLVRRSQLESFCQPFLDQVGLRVPPGRMVGELPMGRQQLVAIARALSMNARILVMDESTSSLTDEAVEVLFKVIEKLKAAGVSIIYVSHKMDEIFRICDRATVLRDGEYVGTRDLADSSIDEIIAMMVGREVDRTQRTPSSATDEVLLEVDGFTTPKIRHVSFAVHRGEVLGIAGLVGSGRAEIGEALFGLRPVLSGSVTLKGRPYRPRRPREAMDEGFGLVPRDRKTMGLMMQMSVRENAVLSRLPRLQQAGFVRRNEEREQFHDIARRTRLKAADPRHPVSTLSGGNQQKVLLGRWLMVDPDILFLDDPTRGVDVGAKNDIYTLIEGLAAGGKAVLMVSSELPELLRCCDRILVMNGGEAVAMLDAATTSQEEIMSYAAKSVAS